MKPMTVALAAASIFVSVASAQTDERRESLFDAESTRAALAYKLNPDNLHRFLDATKTISAMIDNDLSVRGEFRDFAASLNQSKEKSSLDGWAAALEQWVPTAAAAIRKASLTPHDYVLVLVVVGEEVDDMSFHSDKLPPEVSAENAAFVREHTKEIAEVMEPFGRASDSLKSKEPR
jgi:hypothetical protein